MELKDFIRTTLREIIDGVAEAQKEARGKGANINPMGVGFTRNSQWNYSTGAEPQAVSFDVALTESKGTGTEGGVGVFLGGIGLGSKGRTEAESVSLTRIQFSVPVILPPGQKVGDE
jgi:hypothetical protein